MAPRPSKSSAGHDVPAQIPGQLTITDALEELMTPRSREDVDWTALDQFRLGELVPVLLRSDAGVMLRSSDRGRACSLGVFVGGRSQWVTCVDQRELLAVLEACVARLEDIAGSALVPGPKRRSQKR